ncbi:MULTISPECIES: DUF3944 domain-containing protein [Enterobacteriaceae]|jgi:uncharacterized protein YaaW (UPF0174 family)|uniref:DUF3944 domain-containing protein n=1 Tax=Enterobacteriaceae TaxID=543 RepID=UPI0004D7BE75|nr:MULTISPECIES: DUF3944 domain-containing protein [Enterobacteriaceae]ELP5689237.1 DUF3944 domain-containing protein [Enterobacter ludwigii]EGT0635598.1 DUF3944 domain-containing protein [Citrobacter freundii]KEL78410.1 ubiquinol-cytochrome C chaperone family protein [Citrobacter freundii]KMK46401.1 oxidoreductase [Klebsiella michiganensis]MBS0845401.1 DUF3944 domain-containing protein [Enterobacter asburiae]
MAVYRNDADLHLLGQCSNEELQLLISILTTDPRDGDTRWTESLTSSPEYRLLAPDHRRYWQLIAAELQRYGANTLMSMARFGQGVVYREILEDVCKKLDVNYNTKSATETIELALLMKVLEKSLSQMTQEELSAFSRTMQLDLTNPTPQLIIMAVQAAIRTSSLAALELATVMSAGIITSLGGIATWGTVVVASRAMSVIAGPVAIALSSAWMISDITGPAYRVTIPACMIVAWLRQQHISR